MDEMTDRDDGDRAIRVEDQYPAHWKADGWAARIIKNEDDDGWAVEMTRDGELEPALVGPWTMGRDKKNPKPLDPSAFSTLVRAANEVRTRHQQQLKAQLHRSVTVSANAENAFAWTSTSCPTRMTRTRSSPCSTKRADRHTHQGGCRFQAQRR